MARVYFSVSSKGSLRWLCLAALVGITVGCVEQGEDKLTKEDEEFVAKNILATAPTPRFQVNADLDGKVTYLGMDVTPYPVEAGKDVRLTHYWKVNVAPGEGWKMFTHISGTNRQGFANVDHGPVSGKYPVSKWKAGQIIQDAHSFRPPAGWSYDHLEVYAGLYKGQERMPVKSGPKDDNRVFCGSIPMNVKAPPPLKRYIVTKTTKPVKVDGKLDEAQWKAAPSTGLFLDPISGNPSPSATEAKLLWNNQYLYIAFESQDSDVIAKLGKRDAELFTEREGEAGDVVEVMIDADKNGTSHIELEVAPNGTIFDTYLPDLGKYEDSLGGKHKKYSWNSKLKAAVKVDGTLNKSDDQDKTWIVEMSLPLADANGLDKPGVKVPPAIGDVWRANLYRLDQSKDKARVAGAWSPPMVGDFHKLARFGEIVFGDEKGEVPPPKPAMDEKPAKDEKGTKQEGKGVKGKGAGKAGKAEKAEKKPATKKEAAK